MLFTTNKNSYAYIIIILWSFISARPFLSHVLDRADDCGPFCYSMWTSKALLSRLYSVLYHGTM
jgi:hypothetical protein